MANTELKYVSLAGLSTFWNGVKDKLALKSIDVTTTASDVTIKVSQNATSIEKAIAAATATTAGVMSAADKSKLDGIASGAQVNVIEGVVVAGANATEGTALSINGKNAVLRVATDLKQVTSDSDPIQPASAKAVVDHVATAVASAQSTLNDSINTVSGVAKANADAIATHAARLTTVESTTTAHATAITNNTASIAANATAIANITATGTGVIDARISVAKNDLTDAINTVSGVAKANADAIATHTARLTTLESASATHATAIANNTASIAANATAIANNTASIAQNALDISGISDRLDTLTLDTASNIKSAVAELRKEILTDGKASDNINDAYDTLQEIANWISDSGSAAKTATQIITELNAVSATAAANATAIATNAALISGLQDSKLDKTTYEAYVLANNATVAANATAIASHAVRLTDLESTTATHTTAIADNAAAIATNAAAIKAESDAREKAISDLTAVVNGTVDSVDFTVANDILTITVTQVDKSSTSCALTPYSEGEILAIFQ